MTVKDDKDMRQMQEPAPCEKGKLEHRSFVCSRPVSQMSSISCIEAGELGVVVEDEVS